MLLGKSIH
jgi:hypothetical protein